MSSKENEIVIQHQKDLLGVFGSVLDERIGMKHSRYVIDDYFSADESIKPCCGAVPVMLRASMLSGSQRKVLIPINVFFICMEEGIS